MFFFNIYFSAFFQFIVILQHTPAIATYRQTMEYTLTLNVFVVLVIPLILFSKNCASEHAEFLALQWLCHEIRNHLVSWTVFYSHISFLNIVCDKEISNIDCSTAFSSASLPILLQKNSTLIVLVDDVLFNCISLCLHK